MKQIWIKELTACLILVCTNYGSTQGQTVKTLEFTSFQFESGQVVDNIKLAYEIRGTLKSTKLSAVLLPSHYQADNKGYDYLIGSDKALNPSKYCLILTNMFANGVSSSPSNTPSPFDVPRFPAVSLRDNVKAQQELVTKELSIQKLKAVIGCSTGGQQAFQWAVGFSEMMEKTVVICGNAKQYFFGIVRLQGSINAFRADDDFKGGDCTAAPEQGLRAFEMHYRAWTQSPAAWDRDLFDDMTQADRELFLQQMSEGFLSLDANNLLSQSETWQNHDVGKTMGVANLTAALQSIKSTVVLMPTNMDQYFPAADAAFEAQLIPNATVELITTVHGHTGAGGSDAAATQQIDAKLKSLLD